MTEDCLASYGDIPPDAKDIEGSMLVPPIRGKCARCKRPILIRRAGQKYGPTCARKIAQIPIEERLDTRPYEQGGGKKAPREAGVCRVCGCTDFLPCPGGCAWVEPDLCSACATDEELRKKIDKQISAEESAVAAYRRAVLA